MCNYDSRENNTEEKLRTDEELKACIHQRNPQAVVTLKIDGVEIGKEDTQNIVLLQIFLT